MPIQVGQLEWFLPQRARLVDRRPGAAVRRDSGPLGARHEAAGGHRRIGPGRADQRLPAGCGGLPGDGLRGVPRARRLLRYGIPEFRASNELVDDVVAKIKLLGVGASS
ncbi:MAG: hypothetical protein R2734_07690 [Nocardioides sp.]